MKTYCKKIDITDPKQIENFVFECFSGRWKENGFINLLIRYGGMTKAQILADAEAQDYNRLLPATAGVAAEIARRDQSAGVWLCARCAHSSAATA